MGEAIISRNGSSGGNSGVGLKTVTGGEIFNDYEGNSIIAGNPGYNTVMNSFNTAGTTGYLMIAISNPYTTSTDSNGNETKTYGTSFSITVKDSNLSNKAINAYTVGDIVNFDGAIHTYGELSIAALEADSDGNTVITLELVPEKSQYDTTERYNIDPPESNVERLENWIYVTDKTGGEPVLHARDMFVAGTQNKLTGYASAVLGRKNQVSGNYNFVAGRGNAVEGYGAFALGMYNTVHDAFTAGVSNEVYSGYAFGNQIKIPVNSHYSFVAGKNIKANQGSKTFFTLCDNASILSGVQDSGVFAGGYHTLGTNAINSSIISGHHHTIENSDSSNISGGVWSKIIRADYSFIGGGIYNSILEGANSSAVFGKSNQNSEPYSIMGGFNGISKENDLFVLSYKDHGPASSDDSYRPFYVTKDGNAKVLNRLSASKLNASNDLSFNTRLNNNEIETENGCGSVLKNLRQIVKSVSTRIEAEFHEDQTEDATAINSGWGIDSSTNTLKTNASAGKTRSYVNVNPGEIIYINYLSSVWNTTSDDTGEYINIAPYIFTNGIDIGSNVYGYGSGEDSDSHTNGNENKVFTDKYVVVPEGATYMCITVALGSTTGIIATRELLNNNCNIMITETEGDLVINAHNTDSNSHEDIRKLINTNTEIIESVKDSLPTDYITKLTSNKFNLTQHKADGTTSVLSMPVYKSDSNTIGNSTTNTSNGSYSYCGGYDNDILKTKFDDVLYSDLIPINNLSSDGIITLSKPIGDSSLQSVPSEIYIRLVQVANKKSGLYYYDVNVSDQITATPTWTGYSTAWECIKLDCGQALDSGWGYVQFLYTPEVPASDTSGNDWMNYSTTIIHTSKITDTGYGTMVHGKGLIGTADGCLVTGTYNIKDENCEYLQIIGNGSSASARSNAYTIDKDGNAWFSGSISLGSKTLTEAQLTKLLALI